MRKQPLPLDPFSLTQITLAIWTTDLLVARKITQAISEQNALITRAMHRPADASRPARPPSTVA